jgi:uncharacterized protein YgbK (DUF1537 family)
MPMRLAVVADDLTGAMDTGVQFAKCGLQTEVMLGQHGQGRAEAVILSTDSRDASATEAYRRAKAFGRELSDHIVYKKIDSTMRGNIGSELDGLLDGLGLEHALVTPAFPAAGRTVVGGYHRVHGTLLTQSPFAHDPVWPASESHVPTLLTRQTGRSVGYLPLSTVESGEQAVIDALRAEPAAIVAADAAEEGHLRTLAMALAELKGTWLPCGSAGLAQEWPAALGWSPSAPTSFGWGPSTAPVLVVAGSRHPTTARQLSWAADQAQLHLVTLSAAGEDVQDTVREQMLDLLAQRNNVGLSTTLGEFVSGWAKAATQMLADLVIWAVQRVSLAGLVLTGGDTARAVCGTLGARALRVLGEVQAGVPAGTLSSGPYDGLRVVTKAGGFGNDQAIAQAIRVIQRGHL